MPTSFLFRACLPVTNTPLMETFQFEMFHGRGRVGGKRPHTHPACRFPGHPCPELHLDRNVYEQPHVFKASGRLVLSSAVRSALGAVRGVEFAPVVVDAAFRLPYRLGESPAWIDETDPDRWFDEAVARAEMLAPEAAGELWECRTYTVWEAPGMTFSPIEIPDPCSGKVVSVDIADSGAEGYEIYMTSKVGYVVQADIAERLRPFLREPYMVMVALPTK